VNFPLSRELKQALDSMIIGDAKSMNFELGELVTARRFFRVAIHAIVI
jgi:hypothetical protein